MTELCGQKTHLKFGKVKLKLYISINKKQNNKTMKNYNQLCVWPATVVGKDDVKDLENFFKEEMDVRVKYKTEVLTNPDLDGNGNEVPDTGGRNDLFFYVHDDDIGKFAVPRLSMGIRWYEDVVSYNDGAYLYPQSFLEENPITW